MTNDSHVLDLLPAYVLGSLEAEEARQVEEHLAGCLICRNESDAFQMVTGQLSLAVPAAVPPPELRDRLVQRLHAARPEPQLTLQVPKRSWLERLLPVWGLASFCLIIALAAANLLLWQRLNKMDYFSSPGGMRAVPLSAPDTTSPATGFVLISASGNEGALVVDGLPQLAEDQQYQLWLIRDGQRTSGAVFSTDETSYGGTRIRAPGSLLGYSAADITIEPTGGSKQPTGTSVLGGPLLQP